MKFIKDDNNNNDNSNKTTIIPVLVDEGLTPIIQVPGVVVNKTFKQKLKEQYYKHRLELDITIGTIIPVSRDKFIEFVLNAIEYINNISTKTFPIQDAFKYCGFTHGAVKIVWQHSTST